MPFRFGFGICKRPAADFNRTKKIAIQHGAIIISFLSHGSSTSKFIFSTWFLFLYVYQLSKIWVITFQKSLLLIYILMCGKGSSCGAVALVLYHMSNGSTSQVTDWVGAPFFFANDGYVLTISWKRVTQFRIYFYFSIFDSPVQRPGQGQLWDAVYTNKFVLCICFPNADLKSEKRACNIFSILVRALNFYYFEMKTIPLFLSHHI